MISRNALDVCSDNEWWHIEGFETAVFSPETWHLHHKIGAYCNRPHEVLKEMACTTIDHTTNWFSSRLLSICAYMPCVGKTHSRVRL